MLMQCAADVCVRGVCRHGDVGVWGGVRQRHCLCEYLFAFVEGGIQVGGTTVEFSFHL